ncbi:Uncharacterized protein PBTT_10312 [Plasmodiophora brassicae]
MLIPLSVLVWAATSSSQALTVQTVGGQPRTLSSYGFATGNTSFSVSAMPWFASGERPATLDAGVANRVVFVEVTTVTINVADWARACHGNACAGLVFYIEPSSLLRTIVQMLAWSYWTTAQSDAFASLPMLVVVDDVDAASVLSGRLVTMTSDRASVEQNPAAVALRLPSTIALFSFIAVAYVCIIVFDVVRVLQFVVDDKWRMRAPPWPVTLSIGVIMVAHVTRTIRAANLAWFHEQGISYPYLVLFTYLDLPITAMSRSSLNLTITRSLEAEGQDRSVLMADRLGSVVGLLITIAMFVIVLVAAGTEVLPMGVIATYLMLLAPSIIFSVSNGYACLVVVRRVLQGQRQAGLSASADALRGRRAVARRLGAAWSISTLLLASHLVVLAVQNVSPGHFLAAYGVSQIVGMFSATAMLIAYRPKSSAVCVCRRIAVGNRNQQDPVMTDSKK